jgi:tRNA modification GTPase
MILISAKNDIGIDQLKNELVSSSGIDQNTNEIIVTNVRHYDALLKVYESLNAVQFAITESIPGDLLAIDIRHALHHLGEITGEVTTEDLLGNIFSKFCIGK